MTNIHAYGCSSQFLGLKYMIQKGLRDSTAVEAHAEMPGSTWSTEHR